MYQDAGQTTEHTQTHMQALTHIQTAAESYPFQENIGQDYKRRNGKNLLRENVKNSSNNGYF